MMTDSFDGIIEFVAVAETRGFSAAAKRLGCSTSHVSRQVLRLEERLGVALFTRTTRQVSLTDQGQAYYRQCADLVGGLQQANEQVTQQQVHLTGTLRVSAAGGFAEQFVAPALMAFAADHPDLVVDVDLNSRAVNLIEDGIDFAIRYGELRDSGLIARKLVRRHLMAVASPAYLAAHGEPAHPDDLVNHHAVLSNMRQWPFVIDGQQRNVRVEGRWRSNSSSVIIRACEEGLGIGYQPVSSFRDALQRQTLLPILRPFWAEGASSWIVYRRNRFLPLRSRMAIDYLVQYFDGWDEREG